MRRLNFLDDGPWDEVADENRRRVRWFGHPFGADMLGASLMIELLPGAPGGPTAHALRRRGDVLRPRRNADGTYGRGRGSAPARGTSSTSPEGRDGLHDFSNPADQPARVIHGISTKRFPERPRIPRAGSCMGRDPPPRTAGRPRTPTRESSRGLSYRRNRQTGSSRGRPESEQRRTFDQAIDKHTKHVLLDDIGLIIFHAFERVCDVEPVADFFDSRRDEVELSRVGEPAGDQCRRLLGSSAFAEARWNERPKLDAGAKARRRSPTRSERRSPLRTASRSNTPRVESRRDSRPLVSPG